MLNDEESARQLAEQLGLRYLNFHQALLDEQLWDLLPEALARTYRMLPWRREEDRIVVAMVDPRDPVGRDIARTLAGTEIEVVVVSESALKARFREVFQGSPSETQEEFPEIDVTEMSASELTQHLDRPPIVRIADLIITQAVRDGATNIHIEPYGRPARVRFRLDGRLITVMKPPPIALSLVLHRFKLMGQLDLVERRIPQSGRLQLKFDGHEHDIHLHCLPTHKGEKLVLHLVSTTQHSHLEDLGMDPETLRNWGLALQRRRGMLLVTGPQDCGKTTTLYACLRRLANEERNVTSIEHVVQQSLDLINQVQLNSKAGLVYSSALRNAAQQDCDAIVISELHSSDVAQLALETAHRDCLVVSVVHHDRAAAALGHLLFMHCQPALVASALKGVLAQRLLARLCPHCKRPAAAAPELLERLGLETTAEIFESPGCEDCQESGRARGRLAIFEYLPVTPELSRQIVREGDRFDPAEATRFAGIKTLPDRVRELLADGQIGLEEALSLLNEPL